MAVACAPKRPINVWLNPAAGASVSDLADGLRHQVHLIVVPKTGSRRADVAVLRDPQPAELETIARVLAGTPLLATMTTPPTAALSAAAQRVGARLLNDATAPELLEQIELACTS